MSMSALIEREPCPHCRKKGYDNKGDNLAVYSDGHKWCYRCGHYEPAPNTIERVKEKLEMKDHAKSTGCIDLPSDITPNLSPVALAWLIKYDLSEEEMDSFWWSEEEQQLIYPIFDSEGQLLIWQARNFGNHHKEKYFTTGAIKDHFQIFGDRGPLILTEDVISAMKVGRHFQAMPLFGGYISKQQLIRLRDFVLPALTPLGFWLDDNKLKDAMKFKNAAIQLGIQSFVVNSKQDPKCYSDKEIVELVTYWKGTQ